MPTPFEVPSDLLVERLAKYLKENVDEVTPPDWSHFAKTGSHKERPPLNRDWWFYRCASLLRKLYIHGPLGVSRLRTEYGGRKKKEMRREHSKRAGGSAIREPLQQLETAGFVLTQPKEGRRLTGKGVSLVNKVSGEILKERRGSETDE